MTEHRAAAVLACIQKELTEHFAETAGEARVERDTVFTAQDRLLINVDARESEPGMAHVHVFAALPPPAQHVLEACIFSSTSSRGEASKQAALIWTHCVAAPILSMLTARPVGEADHFDGTEPWGVPGGHGFVGPAFVRGENIELLQVNVAPLFAGLPFDLRDGEVHLVKVVAFGQDGRWKRTFEVNGDNAPHADAWPDGPPCPQGTVSVVRFAVTWSRPKHPCSEPHPADNPLADMVRAALPVFVRGTAKSDEWLVAALQRAGCEPAFADPLAKLVPAAFVRVMMAESGAKFSSHYQRRRADGTITPVRLLAELPLYTAALEVARSGVSIRTMAAAAQRSAEASVVRGALQERGERPLDRMLQASDFRDFTFAPLRFVDANVPAGLFERHPIVFLALVVAIVAAWWMLV